MHLDVDTTSVIEQQSTAMYVRAIIDNINRTIYGAIIRERRSSWMTEVDCARLIQSSASQFSSGTTIKVAVG